MSEPTTEGSGRRPRLLLISASDYRSAVIKGVAALLADFDEGGFFDRVLIAFPFARSSSQAQVSARVWARDIGPDWIPFGGRFRAVRRFGAPLHIVRVVAALVRGVHAERVDIVRATDPCFAGLVGWITARLTRRPLCVSIHADWDKRHALGGASSGAALFGSRRLAKAIERFVLRRAEMVMPIRDSLRTYALDCGVRPERIRVIPHGADLSPFVEPSSIDVTAALSLPPNRAIVSFVGRLVRENYVDDLLALARRLGAKRTDWILLLVGGGPDAARLEALVSQDPELHRIVRFTGFQPREVVAAVRQQSAVSLCLMGGFSLIEACAAGSPVVSYDVEWHGELVRSGETGYLVREHDIDGLALAVDHLLTDRAEGAAAGRRARVLALERHGLDRSIAVKQQCYVDMMNAQGHSGH